MSLAAEARAEGFAAHLDTDGETLTITRGWPSLESLVAHWRLEEASGDRVDEIGDNDLTDVNTVGQAAGKLGNAASFTSANNEALSIEDNSDLSMGDIDFTITGWVKFAVAPNGGLVGKWATGSLEYLVYTDGSRLVFAVSDDGAFSFATVQEPTLLQVGTWYFFAAWHDADSNTINLSLNNGVAAGANHSGGAFNGTSTFYLGRNEDGGTSFNGQLDSVSVWKRLLTAAERTQLYNGGDGLDNPITTITALVNRDPFEKRRGDSPSFTPGDVSSIEFSVDALSPEIEVGESFSDQFDHTHRVQSIKRMGNKVRCHCEVSE